MDQICVENSACDICYRYGRGDSARSIAFIHDISPKTVLRRLRNHNTPRRHQFRRYSLDENYFSIIDTADKAYWLGFLLADGNISPCGRNKVGFSLRIALQNGDVKHLEMLRSAIGFSGNIKVTSPHGFDACWLTIISTPMCRTLLNLGWNEFKKYGDTFILDSVPKYFQRDLIRGLIDGDGWILISGKGKAIYGFCSKYRSIVDWVMSWFVSNVGLNSVKISNPSAYRFSYSGNRQIKKIITYIGSPKLIRKSDIADRILLM